MRKTSALLSASLVLLVLLVVANYVHARARFARLKPGMTASQAEALLGRPASFDFATCEGYLGPTLPNPNPAGSAFLLPSGEPLWSAQTMNTPSWRIGLFSLAGNSNKETIRSLRVTCWVVDDSVAFCKRMLP